MIKLNKNISIGMFIVAITLLLNNLIKLPDFIYGLGFGTGIGLELIGIYSMKHDISKLKSYKINFIRKCLNK